MRRLIATIGGCAVVLVGCAGSSAPPTTSARVTTTPATTTHSTTTRSSPPRQHKRRHAVKAVPNPGTLPQTTALPSSATSTFRSQMRALWTGIRTDSVHAALPSFFPLAAYEQVKAIADPAADYQARLVGDFQLDIGAAHALLGAGSAQLVSVNVPQAYAHWVDPNVCYNRVGYYEVPNARVVYREGGQIRSFGIASMISWRGVWYVVHLGAVLRSGGGGELDDPSVGPGTSAPSSTC